MANPEHVEILKQGPEVWNRWFRTQSGYCQIDLSKAMLNRADFRGYNFRGVNLGEACLFEANLRGTFLGEAFLFGSDLRNVDFNEADLTFANLSSATLNGTDLSKADLSHADLRETDLRSANLTETSLFNVDFTRALLKGADLSKSKVAGAVFSSSDLANAKGLTEIDHRGSSSIGIDTIFLSKGKIPEVFLRGCGLNDWQIEFAKLAKPGLDPGEATQIGYDMINMYNGQGIQYYSCFISYNSQDQEFAQKLHDDLQDNGVRCWFAPEDIKGGRKIHYQIDEAIRIHDKLVIILSEHSIQSDWVAHELKLTRKREKELGKQMLFPICLVDYEALNDWELFDADTVTDLASEVRQYFIPDFSEWENETKYQEAFERLLKDLKADQVAV